MECMMPNREYERTMNHTYIILEKCSYFGGEEEKSDYRKHMLLENSIPGLLPVTCKNGDGSSRYYYEINSLETLDKLYEEAEITFEQLQKLLLGVIRLFQSLEEYLLEGTQIIMRPDYIYLEPEQMEPYFICFPDYEGDIRQEFVELVDYVLAKVDHTDERAVMLGYQVYRYTRNPNYVLSEIHHMLKLSGESEVVNVPSNRMYTPADEVSVQNDNSLSENGYRELVNDNVLQGLEHSPVVKSNSKVVQISTAIAIAVCLFFAEEYMLGLFGFSGKQMIYLCGVAALACMIAGILYYGNKKQSKQTYTEVTASAQSTILMEERAVYGEGTICLTEDVVKSPFYSQKHSLVGIVNGEEINYPLQRFPLTIGKQEGVSDLVVSDNTVSRQHARLEQIDGRVYIVDTNSTNGTIKNGKLLAKDELELLETGDKILLGNVSFTFS